MRDTLYHIQFRPGVRLSDAELTLKLALLAAEGVHGTRRVRGGCTVHRDPLRHALTLRANARVGATVARVLASFLTHEFGKGAFSVRRRQLASIRRTCNATTRTVAFAA